MLHFPSTRTRALQSCDANSAPNTKMRCCRPVIKYSLSTNMPWKYAFDIPVLLYFPHHTIFIRQTRMFLQPRVLYSHFHLFVQTIPILLLSPQKTPGFQDFIHPQARSAVRWELSSPSPCWAAVPPALGRTLPKDRPVYQPRVSLQGCPWEAAQ